MLRPLGTSKSMTGVLPANPGALATVSVVAMAASWGAWYPGNAIR